MTNALNEFTTLDMNCWHEKVLPFSLETQPGIALIGFSSDEGVKRNGGRAGAALGPKVLRKSLANLSWHAEVAIYDAGDVTLKSDNLEVAQSQLGDCVAEIIKSNNFPIVFGGGQETAWGTFQGLSKIYADKKIGIINLDSHFNLNQHEHGQNKKINYFCIGISEANNTKELFNTASELNVKWIIDKEIQRNNVFLYKEIDSFLDKVDVVYLSIDLGVLPCYQMPAVSTPSNFGIPLFILEQICCYIAKNRKIIAADFVEFNPNFDIDHHGARVASRLIWEFINTYAKK